MVGKRGVPLSRVWIRIQIITQEENSMRKTTMIPAVIAILTAILACNLPSTTPSQQNPDAILTAAAFNRAGATGGE